MLHLLVHFIGGQFETFDLVVAVESAVRAVAAAEIGNIHRRVQRDRPAEILAGQLRGSLRQILKKERIGVGKKRVNFG